MTLFSDVILKVVEELISIEYIAFIWRHFLLRKIFHPLSVEDESLHVFVCSICHTEVEQIARLVLAHNQEDKLFHRISPPISIANRTSFCLFACIRISKDYLR